MNVEDIYKWIDGYSITRQKKNINRDFSDAVPMAEMLKVHYPKFVDLHNYSPSNTFSQKQVNWNMLNKKVLSKIGLPLSKETQEQLSKSVPGAIEKVLLDLKSLIDAKSKEKESKEMEILYFDGFPNEPSDPVLPIKLKNGSKISNQKMVPAELFEKMQSDLTEQEESITALRTKVQHLEALISIKDERIKDLTHQIQTKDVMVKTPRSPRNMSNTRFFKKVFST